MEIPTPEELKQQQENQDESAFNQAVTALSENLRRQYVGEGPVDTTIVASLVNKRVQKKIISAFYNKGWILVFMKMVPDQRDGDYYEVRIQAQSNANANATPRN